MVLINEKTKYTTNADKIILIVTDQEGNVERFLPETLEAQIKGLQSQVDRVKKEIDGRKSMLEKYYALAKKNR